MLQFRQLRWLFLPLLCLIFPEFVLAETLRIGTTLPDTTYYAIGNALAEVLAKTELTSQGIKNFRVVPHTDPTVVLSQLQDQQIDLGIVPSDMLAKIEHAHKETPIVLKDLRIKIRYVQTLTALYPQYIQVLVRKESNITSMSRLKGKKIYIGQRFGDTLTHAEEILDFYRIDAQDYTNVLPDLSPAAAVRALRDGDARVEAVFITHGQLQTENWMNSQTLSLLPIEPIDLPRFRAHFPYLSIKRITELDENVVYLAYTRAVLLARKPGYRHQGLPRAQAYSITHAIYQNEIELEKLVEPDITLFRDANMVRRLPLRMHIGAEDFFVEQGILMRFTVFFSFLFIMFLISVLIIITHFGTNWHWVRQLEASSVARYVNNVPVLNQCWSALNYVTTKSVVLSTIWVLAFVFLLNIGFMILIEEIYSIQNDISTPFAEMSFSDTVLWITIFAITGSDQGIYPNTNWGKISAALIPLLGVGSLFFIAVYENLSRNYRYEKQLRGYLVPKLSNHIVICGWNHRVPNIIKELICPNAPGGGYQVIVIANLAQEKPLEPYSFRQGFVHYYRGISSDYQKLRHANVAKAACVIIVADRAKVLNKNARGIFSAVAVRNEATNQNNPSLRIIAEVLYADNEKYFVYSQVTKLVSITNTSRRLLIHACLNPGMSGLLVSLLSLQHAGLHAQVIPVNHSLVGKSYYEIIRSLRKDGILLMAVYRWDLTPQHTPLELEFRTEKSPYLLNPTAPEELSYRLAANDKLLVVMRSQFVAKNKISYLNQQLAQPFQTAQQEVLLIVGYSEIVDTLIQKISPHCQQIIHVIVQETESPPVIQGDLVTIYTDSLELCFGKKYSEYLHRVTRVMVLGPAHLDVSEQGVDEDDDQTMMYALAIIGLYQQFFNRASIHIMAEMRKDDNLNLFHDIGIAQPIPTNGFLELIATQMSLHSGLVTEFFLKTMQLDNHKAILRKIPVQAVAHYTDLLNMTYDAVLEGLLSRHMQLLAIEKANGEIICNPNDATMRANRLQKADSLYVFASPIIKC